MGRRANCISLEKCKYYFDWNENGELFWKNPNARRCKKGDLAGYKETKGYFSVHVEGKDYKSHRILYQLYYNIELDEYIQIDHINGIKDDNRKENLRLCTNSENQHNTKKRKNNLSTGIKNIFIMKSKNYEYFRIQIQKDGKYVYREYFRTDKYTLEQVIEIRNEKLKEIHGEYYNLG